MIYSGDEYIKEHICPEISEFGSQVANILGYVYKGIYHIPQESLKKAHWQGNGYVEITINESLATYDYDRLTQLVVLCHDGAVRMEISAVRAARLRLIFHKRQREGRLFDRHPTIEDAVKAIREAFDKD